EIAQHFLRVIAQQNGADALLALRDQNRAETAFADRETDARMLAAAPVVPRLHAQHARRSFVEAALGTITGGVDRVGDRGAAGKRIAHTRRAMRARIFARRQTGARLEDAMEVRGT